MIVNRKHRMISLTVDKIKEQHLIKQLSEWVLGKTRLMRNFRTSKYKKPKYFVNKNKHEWEVVEFPTNDIIRVFKRKIDAEMFFRTTY